MKWILSIPGKCSNRKWPEVIIVLVIIILSVSCAGGGENPKDQSFCGVYYLKSEIPDDSMSGDYIFRNYNGLEWGILNEKGYAELNRRNELWYRVILPDTVAENHMLVMPAYSHGFEVFNGDHLVYQSGKEGMTYFRIHVIPLTDSKEPVFIRFRYRNFNNAIIRYPVYLVPEKELTEDLSVNKFNPFAPAFLMIFPGTALFVLGSVSILLFLRRRFKEYKIFFYFGMFSLMTGVLYILPVSRLRWLNLSPDLYFAIEHFVVHVLLIFFVLLNITIFNAGKSLLFKVLLILFIILALLDFPVFLIHPLPFISNVILGLLLGVFIVASVITGYRDTRQSRGGKTVYVLYADGYLCAGHY